MLDEVTRRAFNRNPPCIFDKEGLHNVIPISERAAFVVYFRS